MNVLRLGLVGVGHMGRLHLSKIRALVAEDPELVLAGVVDNDRQRLDEADTGEAPTFANHGSLAGRADAVIVAVPTVAHYEVVRDLLKAGLDVLVEKPLASTLEEAEELLSLARSTHRVLQVGHLERFNPALSAARSFVKGPLFVEAHRLGPFPARATDVDVVRDLMIHDLDLVQDFVGEEPLRVEAVGVPVLTDKVDIANARVTFPGGCVANLTASRVTPNPMRKLRLFQPDGYLSIDFLDQTVVQFRRRLVPGESTPKIEMEKLDFDPEDALLAQLRAFVDALREGGAPVVSGEEALSALRSALRVIEAMPVLTDAWS